MRKDRFDTSIFEKFVRNTKLTSRYQPVIMLAGRKGKAYLVQCSTDAEPPRWNICMFGGVFDVTFLDLKDLDRFIEKHNLREWTVEDDKKYKRNLSNFCQSQCRIDV